MVNEHVLIEVESRVATVVLNEREKKNALTNRLLHSLLDVLQTVASNPHVRVIVIKGCNGSFSVGGDLEKAASSASGKVEVPLDQSIASLRNFMKISELLRDCPQVTVGAINGTCAGAGLSLAAACDLRIATDTAIFRTAFIDAARSGDFGGTWLLTHLLGEAKAKELYLLNDKIDAQESLRIGLVSRVFSADHFDGEVAGIARALANKAGMATRYMKRNLNESHKSFSQALDSEAARHAETSRHPDAAEAAAAFLAKRKPVFQE